DDGGGGAHLHAQLAELACVELEREDLGVVPLLGLQHLDLDHLRRADVLAEAAADAVLFAAVLVVGERQDSAKAVRVDALDVRIVDGDGLAAEVLERDAHGTADGTHELAELRPEARMPVHPTVRHRRHPAARPGTPSRAAEARSQAAAASTTPRGSGPRGSARSSTAPRSPRGTR